MDSQYVLTVRRSMCWEDVTDCSVLSFLEAMKAEMGASLFCDVCEVIRLHASEKFAAYVDYIRNMPYQEQTLHNLG